MNRVCSMFSQVLQLVPRDRFESAVVKHNAERHSRGFSSWGQFIAMLFCQLGGAKSLREITEGLQASEGKLRHLGLPEAPARSTLAYANSHRPWELFETVFHQLLADCQKRLGMAKAGARLGLPGKLLSLDATVIDLCAAVFDWAQFRTTKGAVKLHLLLDHDGYLPCYAVITEGKVHEIQVARKLSFQRGTMLVFDRGYTDYGWFQRLTEESVHFVTRLKDNATYVVVEERQPAGEGVVSDEIIVLEKQASSEQAPFLRRVLYWDASTQKELVFLTNHLDLAAATVAAIYKQRWQIELLFKALKQNLRIKTFVGTTANALKTQIWTALIALLTVKFLQLQAKFPWSLSRLVALLRQQLFVYRDLWLWLEKPFEPPIPIPDDDSPQLSLTWNA
ncbi:MAG: IS4 family transposase [Acidobacteriota bacterium]|nr:IS4 family transposase [Acidobacteriota bacterium]